MILAQLFFQDRPIAGYFPSHLALKGLQGLCCYLDRRSVVNLLEIGSDDFPILPVSTPPGGGKAFFSVPASMQRDCFTPVNPGWFQVLTSHCVLA
jgi:hypothetical protein